MGIAALHEGQGGNPWNSFSFESKHRSPVALGKWDSPCGTVGPDFVCAGRKGESRNVPAFFRVLRGKRKGMGLVVRGEGGFC